MKRSEPTKNLVDQKIIDIFNSNVYKVGPFVDKTMDLNETNSFLVDVDQSGIEDAFSLLSETMQTIESLHDYFYNGDRSLDTPPIVLLNQLFSFQIESLMEEINDLKKNKINECVIIVNNIEVIGYVDKNEYLNYLSLNYLGETINKLIKYIKQSDGNSLIQQNIFNENEILDLLRKGLLWERKKNGVKEYLLFYPKQFQFVENLCKWRKKLYSTINASPFHSILKTKLADRYDSMCFNIEYMLCDLIGNSQIQMFVKTINKRKKEKIINREIQDTIEYIQIKK